MEENKKSKLDNYTMILNHILVIMITFGAGSTKMLIDGKTDIWFYSGATITISIMIVYVLIYVKKLKILKGG